MKEVQTKLMDKDTKKKVEKAIDSILKELGMTRKEFDEVKGVSFEMKASGQVDILTPTPIVVVGPTKEVIVVQTSAQAPTLLYVVVAQQQLQKKGKELVEKKVEEVTPLVQRKSSKLAKTKNVINTSSKRRVKETTSR